MEHRRIWRGLDADLFRFTTTDGRDLHTAVMSAFEDSAVTAAALDIDQVRRAVHAVGWDEPTDDGALERALHQLTTWGLLEATQNHAASYASPEDFERKNLQWSRTRRGEAGRGCVAPYRRRRGTRAWRRPWPIRVRLCSRKSSPAHSSGRCLRVDRRST